MATHSTILAWEIPWTEEPGGLQSMGSEKSQTCLSDQKTTTKSLSILNFSLGFVFLRFWTCVILLFYDM